MLKVNLLAPMILTRYLAPPMAEHPDKVGHILNVSSIYGRDPVPSFDAYAATKHGLSGWTMSTYAVRVLLHVTAPCSRCHVQAHAHAHEHTCVLHHLRSPLMVAAYAGLHGMHGVNRQQASAAGAANACYRRQA